MDSSIYFEISNLNGTVLNSIIENTLGEYEGDLHFDIGGGWLDAVIPISI